MKLRMSLTRLRDKQRVEGAIMMKWTYLVLLIFTMILFGCSPTSESRDNTDHDVNDTERGSSQKEQRTTQGSKSEEKATSEYSETILYKNKKFGFTFTLPKSWEGYKIITQTWEGTSIESNTTVESGPTISLRHPKWRDQSPRQDIPIMIFTINQWNSLQQGEFTISAAGVSPTILGQNNRYVFLLPARYNYGSREGVKEVEDILKHDPIHTKNVYGNKDTECQTPPKSLEWDGKRYTLEEDTVTLEPGMKFGYMVCENGSLIPSNDPNSSVTIYSNGDPRTNNDIVVYGDWDGGVLYSIDGSLN